MSGLVKKAPLVGMPLSHVPFGRHDSKENYDVNQLRRPSQTASARAAIPLLNEDPFLLGCKNEQKFA